MDGVIFLVEHRATGRGEEGIMLLVLPGNLTFLLMSAAISTPCQEDAGVAGKKTEIEHFNLPVSKYLFKQVMSKRNVY